MVFTSCNAGPSHVGPVGQTESLVDRSRERRDSRIKQYTVDVYQTVKQYTRVKQFSLVVNDEFMLCFFRHFVRSSATSMVLATPPQIFPFFRRTLPAFGRGAFVLTDDTEPRVVAIPVAPLWWFRGRDEAGGRFLPKTSLAFCDSLSYGVCFRKGGYHKR